MKRRLFCEISPLTYKISTFKCCVKRTIYDFIKRTKFAKEKSKTLLPITIYKHKSLIRRKLGTVNMDLQQNKAINLSIAAPKISNVIISPQEIFSIWYLVGRISSKKGYKVGLTISQGQISNNVGGGLCQLSNLIHWMVLHTSMDIIEHHHHDGFDLFPDFNRQIPFGTGTSILYNYLDYRFKNNTNTTYQMIVHTTDKYLCGEIRANQKQNIKYHIVSENDHFEKEGEDFYRLGDVYRKTINISTGECIENELIRQNHAKVMYQLENS